MIASVGELYQDSGRQRVIVSVEVLLSGRRGRLCRMSRVNGKGACLRSLRLWLILCVGSQGVPPVAPATLKGGKACS